MSELPGGTFGAQMDAFAAKVRQAQKDIFVNVFSATLESITEGSAVTGSPGVQVDTGFSKGQWIANSKILSETEAIVATNVSYAPTLNSGVRSDFDPRGVDNPKPDQGGPHRPSQVGGPHHVDLTVANFGRLVEAEARKVVG